MIKNRSKRLLQNYKIQYRKLMALHCLWKLYRAIRFLASFVPSISIKSWNQSRDSGQRRRLWARACGGRWWYQEPRTAIIAVSAYCNKCSFYDKCQNMTWLGKIMSMLRTLRREIRLLVVWRSVTGVVEIDENLILAKHIISRWI